MTTKITEKNISNIANRFIQWQSVITADGSTATSAVAGQGYLIDTTSATHTINLPTSASNGDSIVIKDYAGTFNTNNLTIGRNGHNIQGAANDSLITSNRASLTLVYIDSTKGWVYTKESNVADLQQALFITATGGTVTTSGDFKIHTFTGDGCFVVSSVGNPAGGGSVVDYLVVAGGGSGGSQNGGGGGGGGFRETHSVPVSGCYTASPLATPTGITVSATTYPVTVGGGGAGVGGPAFPVSPAEFPGNKGSDSSFSTITSTGGGLGASPYSHSTPFGAANISSPGGSGGGGVHSPQAVGTGNTPPVNPPQGNPGSYGTPYGGYGQGGGGGGAGSAATNGTGPVSGVGGNGATTSITNTPTTYAGGGGGGADSRAPQTGGAGGSGGGTAGVGPGNSSNSPANSGGGTGGGAYGPGGTGGSGNGGKGIVVIRYKFQ